MKHVMFMAGSVLLISVTVFAEDQHPAWGNTLLQNLESVSDKQSFQSAKERREAYVTDVETGKSTALIGLWLFDENDEIVKRSWWSSKNPEVRVMALALYLCLTKEPTSFIPDFESWAGRFEQAEKTQRLEEIAWVEKNRPLLARSIADWIDQNIEPNQQVQRRLLAYRAMARSKP
jgi:hypothetical protein